MGSKHSLQYRTDIDGLRGIAVLMVVLFHAHLTFRGGFVGVDIFFVLSGYLITSLMLRDLELNTFRLADFWERRIRRIFPALAVMTIGTMVGAWFLLLPDAFKGFGESLVAQTLLASNIHFWGDVSGYFAGSSEEKPLLHMWSLAVEEQFYLFMPFFCLGLHRYWLKQQNTITMRTLFFRVFSFLTLLGLIVSIIMVHLDAHTAFYWLPTRAWELLIGSSLASLPANTYRPSVRVRAALASISFLCLFVVGWIYSKRTPFPGLAALPPCLATAVLIWANSSRADRHWTKQLLEKKPLVGLGLISYSLYLWHWPLLAFQNDLHVDHLEKISRGQRASLMALAVVIAYASWRWIESPIRKRQWLSSRRSLFGAFFFVTLTLGLLGGLIARQDGIPERWSAKARHYSKAVDLMAAKQWPDDAEEIHRGQLPTFGKQPSQVPYKVLVWGDSHAKSIVPAVADLCLEKGQTGTLAAFSATSPTLGFYRHNQHGLDSKSPAWAAKVLEFIRHHQIPRVVLTAKWQDIPGNEPERFGKALMDTVKQLQQAGARVWILLDVPRQTFDVPKALAMYEMFPAARKDPRLQSQTLERYREQNRVMEDLIPLLQQQGAHVLDATSLLFDSKGRSLLEHDGEALYGDSNHLTIQGALRLKPLLRTVLED